MASACICVVQHILYLSARSGSRADLASRLFGAAAPESDPDLVAVYAIYLPSRRFLRLQHACCNHQAEEGTVFTPTALSTMAARYLVVAGLLPSALAIVPNKSAPPHATLLPPSCSPCSRRPRLPVDSSTMQGGAKGCTRAHWRRGARGRAGWERLDTRQSPRPNLAPALHPHAQTLPSFTRKLHLS